MMVRRWGAWGAGAGVLGLAGGCQILSGLSGLHDGSGGGGSMSTATAGGMGGGTSSSTGGMGGGTSSSTGTGGGTSSSTSSSSSGGCVLGTPSDCAFCGNKCGLAACVAGACAPYIVTTATGTTPPVALAADDVDVFCAVSGSNPYIEAHPMGSGTIINVVLGASPIDMVVDGMYVYWLDVAKQSIQYAPKTGGGSAGDRYSATGSIGPLYLVGNTLFWSTKDYLWNGPAAGGSLSNTYRPMAGAFNTDFATDGQQVFWAYPSGTLYAATGDADPGAPISPATTMAWMVADADPGGYVYWTTSTTPSTLSRVPKGGSAMSNADQIATLVDPSGRVLVTDKYVYWADPVTPFNTGNTSSGCGGSVNVYRKPVTNVGMPELLVTVTGCPLFAQDLHAVYWNDQRAIYRQVKP